jgi:hypothetical protein
MLYKIGLFSHCYSHSHKYYVPVPNSKKKIFGPLWGVTHTYVSIHTEKRNIGIWVCIHMRFAGFEPAIPVYSINNFSVLYRHNSSTALHNLYASNWESTADNLTAVPTAQVNWYRLYVRWVLRNICLTVINGRASLLLTSSKNV